MTTTEAAPAATSVIGQRLLRKEDPALLTGEAKFTNDLNVPGALHLAVVRSPYAHARITSIDTSAAAALPGVVAVYTGADLADTWAAPMPCAWPVTDDMKNPTHYPLAVGKVCYAGDGVAAILATSETAALDAIEAVDVQYEPLDAVIDLEDALSDRVVIHEDLGTNKSYTWALKVESSRGRRRQGVRGRRLHGQRALRPAAPRADGDGDPRRRRRAPALRRRHHAVLGDADPAHPQADDGGDARHPRAPGACRRPVGRRRLRLQAQRVRRGAAVHGAVAQAPRAGALERVAARRTPRPRSRAAARSSTSSSPPTPTASSPRCASGCSPTWAPTCSWSRRASRCSAPSSTPACTSCPRRTTSSARRCSRR